MVLVLPKEQCNVLAGGVGMLLPQSMVDCFIVHRILLLNALERFAPNDLPEPQPGGKAGQAEPRHDVGKMLISKRYPRLPTDRSVRDGAGYRRVEVVRLRPAHCRHPFHIAVHEDGAALFRRKLGSIFRQPHNTLQFDRTGHLTFRARRRIEVSFRYPTTVD